MFALHCLAKPVCSSLPVSLAAFKATMLFTSAVNASPICNVTDSGATLSGSTESVRDDRASVSPRVVMDITLVLIFAIIFLLGLLFLVRWRRHHARGWTNRFLSDLKHLFSRRRSSGVATAASSSLPDRTEVAGAGSAPSPSLHDTHSPLASYPPLSSASCLAR